MDNQKPISNQKNIIYLVDKQTFITKMSRVRFHAIEALSKIANVMYWGPNWTNYNTNLTLDENILFIGAPIDYIICYKPSSIKGFSDCIIPKCITYNEMWDEPLTLAEINESNPDLIICHHENDQIRYKNDLFKQIQVHTKLVHIPHCAKSEIFYNKNIAKPIDILLCGSIGKHYPLRMKLREVLPLLSTRYVCKEYNHPGYIHSDSFTDVYLKDFANSINLSKICITCTSKYKYRLGKMVEIPMCGSVLACDLPNQDQDELRDKMIVIDDTMSAKQIKDLLISYLESPEKLETIRKNGYEWSQKYKQDFYAKRLLEELNDINKKNKKIFLIGDELTSIKEKWICDVLKEEFINCSELNIVKDPKDADIIWLLAPWSHRKVPEKLLRTKFVISTIHHIDWNKFEENKEYYNFIESVTNRYHTICPKTYTELRKITQKHITVMNFWINETQFYSIPHKTPLKVKYGLPIDKFIIGSFQKDTEGKDNAMPKLCKGPDLFINIVKDIYTNDRNIHILLTGWRRTYITNELNKYKIPYTYLELVSPAELNELYNCLDLYIVSSRVEGGPRAIMECGMAKVPIISTDVGISELILPKESIYDMNNCLTYKKSKPNVPFAHTKASMYTITNYMKTFVRNVFY
jgi:glycosyltransferase involved in cell wall biosynthesis